MSRVTSIQFHSVAFKRKSDRALVSALVVVGVAAWCQCTGLALMRRQPPAPSFFSDRVPAHETPIPRRFTASEKGKGKARQQTLGIEHSSEEDSEEHTTRRGGGVGASRIEARHRNTHEGRDTGRTGVSSRPGRVSGHGLGRDGDRTPERTRARMLDARYPRGSTGTHITPHNASISTATTAATHGHHDDRDRSSNSNVAVKSKATNGNRNRNTSKAGSASANAVRRRVQANMSTSTAVRHQGNGGSRPGATSRHHATHIVLSSEEERMETSEDEPITLTSQQHRKRQGARPPPPTSRTRHDLNSPSASASPRRPHSYPRSRSPSSSSSSSEGKQMRHFNSLPIHFFFIPFVWTCHRFFIIVIKIDGAREAHTQHSAFSRVPTNLIDRSLPGGTQSIFSVLCSFFLCRSFPL